MDISTMFNPKSITVALLAILGMGPTSASDLLVGGMVTSSGGDGVAETRVDLLPFLDGYSSGRMRLEKATDSKPAASTLTSSSGRFVLKGLEPGMWRMVVTAPGFVPMQFDPLLLLDSRELPPALLVRDTGATFEVRKSSGEPLAGAWVYAESATGEVWKEVGTNGWRPKPRVDLTDDEGRVTFPRAPDEWLDVTVFVPGRVGEKWTQVTGGSIKLSSPDDPGRVRFADRMANLLKESWCVLERLPGP